MTLLDEAPATTVGPEVVSDSREPYEEVEEELTVGSDPSRPLAYVWASPRRLAELLVLFALVLLVATVCVIYLIGPLVHDRDQRALIAQERTDIDNAALDNEGLYRPTLPTQPPTPGSVVGILAIPSIGLEQAVVEGVGPAQTVSGPGHVPGTAGLGQPGNSAVVGRRSGYGGPFGTLRTSTGGIGSSWRRRRVSRSTWWRRCATWRSSHP